MSPKAVLEAFSSLRVFQRGGRRAPHKPLLVLLALARLQSGKKRMMPFAEVEPDMLSLLGQFAPPVVSPKPHHPFWFLQFDDVWEVRDKELLPVGEDRAPTKGNMRAHAHGGFKPALQAALRASPQLVEDLAELILNAHFPETRFREVLEAAGLVLDRGARCTPRDPRFRRNVMLAYGGCCAICGFQAQLAASAFGVDAAHIKWKAARGPDEVRNGIALCAIHHRAFDNGTLGLRDDLTLRVSVHLKATPAAKTWFYQYENKEITAPHAADLTPSSRFLKWHDRQVFIGPARGESRTSKN